MRMNWLRSKLRAWLLIDVLQECMDSLGGIRGKCVGIDAKADRIQAWAEHHIEQQQREICALRGEIAMLKRQVTMQSLPSWTTRFDEQGQRVWADGTMQEVELLKANQQADAIAMLKADRESAAPRFNPNSLTIASWPDVLTSIGPKNGD
jgi:hypothetical protein